MNKIIYPSYKQLASEPKAKLPKSRGHTLGPFIYPFYYTKQKPNPEPRNT